MLTRKCWLLADKPRDLFLWIMGINNGLRASDLLRIEVGDVRCLQPGDILQIIESKTGKQNILVVKIRWTTRLYRSTWAGSLWPMTTFSSSPARVTMPFRVKPYLVGMSSRVFAHLVPASVIFQRTHGAVQSLQQEGFSAAVSAVYQFHHSGTYEAFYAKNRPVKPWRPAGR